MSKDIAELKKKFDGGGYVCFRKHDKGYNKLDNGFKWREHATYKLISLKDAHIAEAVANDSSVEVEFSNHMTNGYFLKEENFFENYQADAEYKLKPKQCDGALNGCYVEASPEAMSALMKLKYEYQSLSGVRFDGWFYISDNAFTTHQIKDAIIEYKIKELHFNKETKEFSEVASEPMKITRDDMFKMLVGASVEWTQQQQQQLNKIADYTESLEAEIKELQDKLSVYEKAERTAEQRFGDNGKKYKILVIEEKS